MMFVKSKSLYNQQETKTWWKKLVGSSETKTQSFPKPVQIQLMPDHIKNYDKNFINWFIGFVEGYGSFDHDKIFIINQKDPKVLYFIKKNLGFGSVKSSPFGYFSFIVLNNDHIKYLINIFHNNIKLYNNQKLLKNWITSFNLDNLNLNNNLDNLEIIKDSAWLSGYIDSNGSFYIDNIKPIFKLNHKLELEKFKNIPYIWEKGKKIGYLNENDYIIDNIIHIKNIEKYLTKYPLKSNKNIIYKKWLKYVRIIEDEGRGKSLIEIQKKAQKINKLGKEDIVQISDK